MGIISCLREEGLGTKPPGSWQRPTGLDVIPESRSGAGPALPRSPPPGPVPSQDAPSPLFLPGFLLPFPVPHPVLGAEAEERLNRSSGGQEPTQANGARAPRCCWDPKQGKSWGHRSPGPFSLRPRSQSPAISPPSTQESRLPFLSSPQTQESEPQLPLPSDSSPGPAPAYPHHSEPLELGLHPSSLRAMLSGERKEGGSPRFGKLHLPVGLWINSPRKQLAKLGRRWPSAASVK